MLAFNFKWSLKVFFSIIFYQSVWVHRPCSITSRALHLIYFFIFVLLHREVKVSLRWNHLTTFSNFMSSFFYGQMFLTFYKMSLGTWEGKCEVCYWISWDKWLFERRDRVFWDYWLIESGIPIGPKPRIQKFPFLRGIESKTHKSIWKSSERRQQCIKF